MAVKKNRNVIIYDINNSLIRRLRINDEPYNVQWFKGLFYRTNVSFVDDLADINNSRIDSVIITIPFDKPVFDNGTNNFIDTIKNIYLLTDKFECLVIRSTLSPEDISLVKFHLAEKQDLLDKIVYFPEFLVEGKEQYTVLDDDRNFYTYFGNSSSIEDNFCDLYDEANKLEFVSNPETLAAIKIGTNIALAAKVTVANALRDVFEKDSVNMSEAMSRIERDPRLGKKYFTPGIGYGGSCLPWAIEKFAEKSNFFQSIHDYNESLSDRLVSQLTGSTLFFGYNFKANVSDTRNSNQLKTIQKFAKSGVGVCFVSDDLPNPEVLEWWVTNPLSCLEQVENVVIFYTTETLKKLEAYLSDEPHPDDLAVWQNINVIDFRYI